MNADVAIGAPFSSVNESGKVYIFHSSRTQVLTANPQQVNISHTYIKKNLLVVGTPNSIFFCGFGDLQTPSLNYGAEKEVQWSL